MGQSRHPSACFDVLMRAQPADSRRRWLEARRQWLEANGCDLPADSPPQPAKSADSKLPQVACGASYL